MTRRRLVLCGVAGAMCVAAADPPPPVLDPVRIVGSPQERARLAGSAHEVGEEELETFEHDDIHRVLDKTPGVYTRAEDGYGLRPNIGLRGASSDRSAKVTLMEDGVLFAPAPYSAPAAYYFPLLTRMTGVEVFKGPASIVHGPNTIGGAVNLVSRDVPNGRQGSIDVGGGSDDFRKAHVWLGWGGDHWGGLAEAVLLTADGFKHLPGGGPTGFAKAEGVARLRWDSDRDADVFHRIEASVGQAGEQSHETYLGLSDDDFAADPYQRYAASDLGLMKWGRRELRVGWTMEVGDDFAVKTTGYRQDFHRAWRKLDAFAGVGAPDLRHVLSGRQAGSRAIHADLLRGAIDSDRSDDTQRLLLGTNDRTFVAQGVQSVAAWRVGGATGVGHDIEAGLRLHHDSIVRDHTSRGAWMTGGALQDDGGQTTTTADNTASTLALAAHLADEIRLTGRLFVTPGVRMENIASTFADRLDDADRDHRYTVFIPGFGAYYQLTDTLGALAGVHRGFSPVSPASGAGAAPERSISYEAGLRYASDEGRLSGELIGFFNDYENLTASCTQSSVGCPAEQQGQQFDGGDVSVWGLEAAAKGRHPLPGGFELSATAAYTLTRARFDHSFASAFGQWGQVNAGDELPYLPRHGASGSLGLATLGWSLDATVQHTSEMRDEAGSGPVDEALRIPPHTVVDVALAVFLGDDTVAYAKLDNALGADYLASRRPFGARPGKPITAIVGLKRSFGP